MGLYRAAAVPLPPPAFYDPGYYYFSGYAPYPAGGYYGHGGFGWSLATPRALRERARIPYQTALRDAQAYHYLNLFVSRDEALLRKNAAGLAEGLAHFRAGHYERAAVACLGAAEANHGDAAARIHAGHALFALGRYDDAVKLIRRAFELQPSLAMAEYDLRADYGNPDDFNRHLEALEAAVARAPRDPAAVLMLGYVRYFTDGPGSGYDLLRRARKLDPRNELTEKLLAVSSKVRPAAPADDSPRPAQAPQGRPARPDSGLIQAGYEARRG